MVNEVIAGRYEVQGLVGKGGMSSVFLAYDRLLERRVALKMLHAELGADEEYADRFRREARAVAQLSHPNIVTVIDRGEQDGRQFIVFEYVDGENLKELVEREGPLPVREALGIALQVGRALAFAHEHGLIHRDVKPHNVLLDDGGRARVTDFGIARSLDMDEASTASGGVVVGTSHYIAPEQAHGEKVDEQTDVYSLGAVLYEELTGQVPYPGDNFVVVAMRHVNDPVPSVRERRPDVSPRLDLAIGSAMAKDPAARPTMDEFLAELEACGKELAAEGGETMIIDPGRAQPVPPPTRRRRRWPWLVVPLIVLLAAGAGVAAFYFVDRNSTHATTTPPPAPPKKKVHVRAVTAYDPQGTGGEHDEAASNATDGDTATYWDTEHYTAGLAGAHKSGVGLVLDAGRTAKLHDLTLTTDTPGFSFEIRGGSSSGGPFPKAIVGSRLASATTRITVPDDAPAVQYYVIWITDLGTFESVHVDEVHTS